MEAIFICQFFASIASHKLQEYLRERKVLAYLVGWVAPWVTYSLSFPGCSQIFCVGLDPFWPLQQVGWSPAHFTASSRRKETFFCHSSSKIHSEDSLRSSASVFAVLSMHSLQSWSRWKMERQREFLKRGGKYCDFLLCCFLGTFPVRIYLSK